MRIIGQHHRIQGLVEHIITLDPADTFQLTGITLGQGLCRRQIFRTGKVLSIGQFWIGLQCFLFGLFFFFTDGQIDQLGHQHF